MAQAAIWCKGWIMKNRFRKRRLYSQVKPQIEKLPAKALKGLIKKPSKPVSIENMNMAIEAAACEERAQ
jgi:hypothetical protein